MEATKRQSLFQIGEDLAALEDLLLQLDGDISLGATLTDSISLRDDCER